MKKTFLIFFMFLGIYGCNSNSKKDYSKPMIEQKDSYIYKTQQENMQDIDSTYFDDENGEIY